MGPTMQEKASSPPTMDATIFYLPEQMDSLASTSTRALRENPVWLLAQDAGVLVKMLGYLPYLFLPFRTSDDSAELYLNLLGLNEMILQSWLFIIEVLLLVLTIPALLFLPGSVFILAAALGSLIIYLIARPMEGPRISFSEMDDETMAMAEQHVDERWVFINGCITGRASLQKAIDRLSKTFGRPVIGIHNKTYGLVADILECLIQRCLSYNTMDVRVAYAHIKAILADPTVTKVVLIGHSQGGIIISLVIDHLFAELPAGNIAKLEIYTFGSAASHFSNPLLSLEPEIARIDHQYGKPHVQARFPKPSKHLIPHIEHYANEYDMIPRWGVLHCVCNILSNRYSGRVFVRKGASGHLFNQHYMNAMFPLLPLNKVGENHGLINTFLDRVVEVDRELVERQRDRGIELGDGAFIPEESVSINGNDTTGTSGGGQSVMIFSRTTSGFLIAEEPEGKTVRELSRLWQYQGGSSPEVHPYPPEPENAEAWMGGKLNFRIE